MGAHRGPEDGWGGTYRGEDMALGTLYLLGAGGVLGTGVLDKGAQGTGASREAVPAENESPLE